MNRTTNAPRTLNWLFNAAQAVLGRGGQIDWSKVTSFARGRFTVKVNGAVAKGATSITVDALTHPLKKNDVLDFGEEESVTVTFSAASVDDTTVTVTALSGPIPSGAILKTADAKEFVKTTAPADEGDTSLTVEALPNALEGGETATYQGGRKLAELTADADVDDTTLAVATLQFAIADNSEAQGDYTGSADKRSIPAGTVMARTSADLLIPRKDATSETATEILQSDANEGSLTDAKSGYGTLIEAQVFENLLPDADSAGDIPADYKTELATNGARINYSDWSDSRFTD